MEISYKNIGTMMLNGVINNQIYWSNMADPMLLYARQKENS